MSYTYRADHIIPEMRELSLQQLLGQLRETHNNAYNSSVQTAVLAYAIGFELADMTRISPNAKEEFLLTLAKCGLFHDIGKLGLQHEFLNYGKFTPDMFEESKKHAEGGASLLRAVGADDEVCLAALHHHERFDGSGYPSGKSGYYIPLNARIVSIANAVEAAMSTTRSHYKEPLAPNLLLHDITSKASSWYDSNVVLAFAVVHQKAMGKKAELTSEEYYEALLKNYNIKKVFKDAGILGELSFEKKKQNHHSA
jgi:putative nucleotidyltransferase with HDIG domain